MAWSAYSSLILYSLLSGEEKLGREVFSLLSREVLTKNASSPEKKSKTDRLDRTTRIDEDEDYSTRLFQSGGPLATTDRCEWSCIPLD